MYKLYRTSEEHKLPHSPQPENNKGIIYVNNVFSPKYTPLKTKKTTQLPKDSASKSPEIYLSSTKLKPTDLESNFQFEINNALVSSNSTSPVIDITEVSVEGLQLHKSSQLKEIEAENGIINSLSTNSYNSIFVHSTISIDTITTDILNENPCLNHLKEGISTKNIVVSVGDNLNDYPALKDSHSSAQKSHTDIVEMAVNDIHAKFDAPLQSSSNLESTIDVSPLDIPKPQKDSSVTVSQPDLNKQPTHLQIERNQDVSKSSTTPRSVKNQHSSDSSPIGRNKIPSFGVYQGINSNFQSYVQSSASIGPMKPNQNLFEVSYDANKNNLNTNTSQTNDSSHTVNESKSDSPDATQPKQQKALKKKSYYYKPIHKYALNNLYRKPSSSSSSPEIIKTSASHFPNVKILPSKQVPTNRQESSTNCSKVKDVDYAAELKHCNQQELHFRLLLQKMNNAALREEMLLVPRTLPPRIVSIAEDISSR